MACMYKKLIMQLKKINKKHYRRQKMFRTLFAVCKYLPYPFLFPL